MEEYEEIDHQVAAGANHHQYQHEVVIMEERDDNHCDYSNQELLVLDQDQLGDHQYHAPDHVQYPMWIPPGFVFEPSELEILHCYLNPKILNPMHIFDVPSLREADIYQHHPQDLLVGTEDNSAYFFTRRTTKGCNKASRTVAGYGYWRMSSTTRTITDGLMPVGEKSSLVFHTGTQSDKDKKQTKTNWLMKEYRTKNNGDEWVVCHIYLKRGGK
ncbi:hypothetical protein MKW94_008615 [Papaver nudicaule]|uniref:NAC domain-containing protein n=1 Tax=Papaver nudicaule TaxID=74823 RepID=A0AA41VQ52_PAPNU|nr:hypothetical protein [Papaver nudicaule]